VFAVDVNPVAAEETKAIINKEGGECTAFAADVSESKEIEAFVRRCVEVYGRIDILHNNVGIGVLGGPEDLSEEDWDRVLAINLKSVFLGCKYVLPHMVRQGGGAIVNISSAASIRDNGTPYIAYTASKAAVLFMVFLIPFFTLLSRKIKTKRVPMIVLTIIILIGLWMERYLLVVPSTWSARPGIPFGPLEVLISAGFFGLVWFCVTIFLSRVPVLPVSDPLFHKFLEEGQGTLKP
jgi:hypothetical protein